ncbi:ATP-dependent helicase [Sunxiuqinia elliptica]|uniref:DNA 3'-5' helicase n=1 Tax=Sunxiuqinia elliptica TaxID=655355 RepID=A0A4R6HA00_9BACT|nr:UvrD-helicase domain-containing protein [Sunxiuqinia elliptica]TDO05182.1 ATP-dependent DNA helicase PcrA [Sunxiuqinia elliptica]TDO64731.1 ATP-dependent DNA helicase PcrA [Sunxiuqinia elliptica]
MNYLEELNEAQRNAVENTDGPSLVIAGAGSGKTRVLTYRIAHLLKQGARPGSILSLTFTNKAAREMKERIASIVGQQTARYLWMGTFHSIFARILRTESEVLGYPSNFTIYDTADSKSLLKAIIKEFKLDDKTYKPNVVSSRISAAKNSLITPAAYAQNAQVREYDMSIRMPRIAEIYKEYARRCFLAGAMDFDDLLLKTNILFRDHKDILKKYQERFDYVLVDEYQDTNFAQYLIVKNLAATHKNLCVVGDDAQSIYSFRGARIENILNFQKDYPEHQVYKLEQNYRSTQTIVNAANSIIQKNKRQLPKTVYSENDQGNKIKVFSALTDNEEGYLVANEISETRMRQHYKYADYAILYRTNAQSRIFEEALRKRNIPYKIYGGLSFYQRKEIKDLLSYFRLVINPKDNEALKRIINYPARGIGATTLSKLEQAALDNGVSIFEIIEQSGTSNHAALNKGLLSKVQQFVALILQFQEKAGLNDAYEMASEIATQTNIIKDLYKDQTPEGLSRFENIQELLNGIQEFSINAREEGQPNLLANYMEDVALLTDQDSEKEEDMDKVTLMTVHSSKGLEFKNVFIVGVEENLFPSSQFGNITPEAFEEERRLFYVALTRAEENAYLSFAKQRYRWGKLDFCNPSRFITEVDEQYLDMPDEADFNFDELPTEGQAIQKQSFGKTGTVGRRPTTTDQPGMKQKLVQLRQAKQRSQNFDGDDPRDIQTGMMVEHQRFGKGKVLQVEGSFPNLKATVFFQNAGQKQLLLKFAKLKIV